MFNYNNCDLIYSFKDNNHKGNLWLGDYTSGRTRKIHRQKNISMVITAGLGMKMSISQPMKHKLYPLYDCSEQNIQQFFENAFEHIDEFLEYGNVLVHCFAGVSRSSTLVISYLMKKMGLKYKEAYDMVKKKRWVVNPNPGFVKQLKRYEIKLKTSGVKEKENPQQEITSKKSTQIRPHNYLLSKTTQNRSSQIVRKSFYKEPKVQRNSILNYSLVKKK